TSTIVGEATPSETLKNRNDGSALLKRAIMNNNKVIKIARKLASPFRITSGKKFRLKNVDPSDTLRFTSEAKPRAKEALTLGIEALAELQDKLYAQDKWAVLLIFQAWTLRARMARSSMSYPASIRKAARFFPLSRLRPRISTTISCGAA